MRVDEFLPVLAAAFDDFPRSEQPRDARFTEIHSDVRNLARPNNLALLNVAASLLEGDEVYVEIGSLHGASLASALIGNTARGIGIDNFAHPDASPEALTGTLERYDVAERAEVLDGDAFELVPAGALDGRDVGVYYYDAAHDYGSQLRGLQMIEPHLAGRALVIVDDSDWEQVERSIRDYLATQPRARTVIVIEGSSRGMPWWWEGMHVLEWRVS